MPNLEPSEVRTCKLPSLLSIKGFVIGLHQHCPRSDRNSKAFASRMLLLITQAFIQVLNFRNNRKLMSSTHSSSILSLSSYDKYGIIPPYDFTIRVRSLAPKPFGGSFKNVLFKYLDDPVDNKADIFMETSKFTVIYDAYPKARIHLLILPKRSNFECNGIEFLSSTDIKNIKELHDLARYIAQSIKRQVAERALTTKSSLLSEVNSLNIERSF